MLTLKTKVSVPKEVIFHAVAEEMVLLDLERGNYFTLDDTGTRFWLLLGEHGELRAVHAALVQEYDAGAEELERDLLELAEKLVANGLLHVIED